jgi:hypothetical protein
MGKEKEELKEEWTPEKKLAYLPDFPRELFVEEAKWLYEDFLNKRYHVELKDAPIKMHTNHKIRVATSLPSSWYSSLYNSSNRRSRRFFKKALERIIEGQDQNKELRGSGRYIYDTKFRNIIYQRLTDGYVDDEGARVFPHNDVRAFFGLEKIEDSETERDFNDEEYKDVIPF